MHSQLKIKCLTCCSNAVQVKTSKSGCLEKGSSRFAETFFSSSLTGLFPSDLGHSFILLPTSHPEVDCASFPVCASCHFLQHRPPLCPFLIASLILVLVSKGAMNHEQSKGMGVWTSTQLQRSSPSPPARTGDVRAEEGAQHFGTVCSGIVRP